jgi:hypothetical protein
VRVTGLFVGGATRQDLMDNAAVLAINDDTTGLEQAYWCEAVFNGPVLTAFRLRKFGGYEQYDLPADLTACDCADGVYRWNRPGGCRHQQALRQALPTVTE